MASIDEVKTFTEGDMVATVATLSRQVAGALMGDDVASMAEAVVPLALLVGDKPALAVTFVIELVRGIEEARRQTLPTTKLKGI